jgi:16S rRNA processing protein RimM
MGAEHPARWLSAGRVGRPHGLDGSFHVLDPSPQLLGLGTHVSVGGRDSTIERRAGDDRRPIVRLEGYGDRSAVETLGGEELLVERSGAPELEADEWWAEDLEGCVVRDRDREVGVVRRLLALPSVDVLEVQRSGSAADLLVPLVSDAVRTVDIDRKQIDIDLRFLGED